MSRRSKAFVLVVITLGLVALSGGLALASAGGGEDPVPPVTSDDAGNENDAAESKDDGDGGENEGDGSLTGAAADKAATAALAVTGAGTVLAVESDDDGAGFEVEIRKEDGTEVEVELDKGFEVVQRADD